MAEKLIVRLEVAVDSVRRLVDSLDRGDQANDERIPHLESLNYSWRSVRNMDSFSIQSHYTTISDSDLDELIRHIRRGLPNSGVSMMLGHLRSVFTASGDLILFGTLMDCTALSVGEGHWTPQQIWVNGMISQDNAGNTAVRDIFDDNSQPDELYGEDPRGPTPNEFDLGSVEVPDTRLPLTDTELAAISHIQPLSVSNNYGVDLYLEIRQLILALMQARQN
ncbi:hypothetical protein OS493_002496 [Desmophyllum pertusum]|uniref:Uncharacterized protein n=1 Tax=Desmophyllum pertusum TaxID=174260 RepID=A0A9W9YT51_9CNID|nr:hypothetical protein OS493_002496 [Desmophyllum pertusum]